MPAENGIRSFNRHLDIKHVLKLRYISFSGMGKVSRNHLSGLDANAADVFLLGVSTFMSATELSLVKKIIIKYKMKNNQN